MQIKSGVSLLGITPQAVVLLMIANDIYRSEFGIELRLTSGSEGKHGYASLHKSGNAIDIGTRGMQSWTSPEAVSKRLSESSGDEVDVVLEAVGTPNEHIHMEWQPKG